MKKYLVINILLLFVSCNNKQNILPENITQIIDSLMVKNEKFCAHYYKKSFDTLMCIKRLSKKPYHYKLFFDTINKDTILKIGYDIFYNKRDTILNEPHMSPFFNKINDSNYISKPAKLNGYFIYKDNLVLFYNINFYPEINTNNLKNKFPKKILF